MTTEAAVWAALEAVVHPSFGMSLVVLGMISGVRVTANGIEVDLVMNCPGCPGATAALEVATRSLGALCGVSRVQLRLLPQTWKPPWDKAPGEPLGSNELH